MDGGTLFQLRNLLNRRNVKKDPTDGVNACEDFFLTVTEGHILAAVMEEFGMSSLADTPCTTLFPEKSSGLEPLQRRNVMMLALQKVVKKYVDVTVPSDEKELDVRSRSGKKVKKGRKGKGKTDRGMNEVDNIREYAQDVLTLGLLYLEFCDAIKEGDGSRILRCWRYLLLVYRASHRTNYAIEAFTLLAHEKYILSPRMALQLKWSRTINTHGRPGKNIPCDLHLEHLNRECKTALSGLGSNITDRAVQRIGRCIRTTTSMLENFDIQNGIPTQSSYHTRRSSVADINKIVQQLTQSSKVFQENLGRKHRAFPNFHRNLLRTVCMPTLKQWMSEQFRKLPVYH